MAIASLKSKNPDLSFIISKNPETKLFGKQIRQGNAFGWFHENDSRFNIYFKDGDDEISFKTKADEQFEFLNSTKFNSTIFVLSCINEFLKTTFNSNKYTDLSKEIKFDTGGFETEFFVNMMYISQERNITLFQKYFTDYTIDYTHIVDKNYSISIKTNKSIHELLNFVGLFSILQAIYNEDAIWLEDDYVKKWVKSLNVVNSPFFFRFVFKKNFLRSERLFNDLKTELEKSTTEKITFFFGDTWDHRFSAVESRLSMKHSVLDLGTGEGRYATKLAPQLHNFEYHAVDTDEVVLKDAERRIKNKAITNCFFYNSIDNFLEYYEESSGKVDCIMSEVIEHMKPKDAENLLLKILNSNVANNIIITTPDVRFNQFYSMSTEFRHEDHIFEWDDLKLKQFIEKCLTKSKNKYSYNWFGIGDIVVCNKTNLEITPSQGIMLTPL